jgi:hypothetical protein
MLRGRRARVSRRSRVANLHGMCDFVRAAFGHVRSLGVRSVNRKPLFFKRNLQMHRNTGLTYYHIGPDFLSPLSAPNQPATLNLGGTKVQDVSPLLELNDLTTLDLLDTNVMDLSPLQKRGENLLIIKIGPTARVDASMRHRRR